jgi:4-hydroxy-2-oxoheptanedioate aldolase
MITALRAAWDEGGTTLGTWTMLNSPFLAESLALVGHDYVCLDQQHGIADEGTLIAGVIAIAAGGAAPLIRVAANEPSMIGKALDCGAAGVIIPSVDNRSDAERAVRSCNYPPHGDRSIGPIRAAGAGRQRQAARSACIVMAESTSAVDNIDDICAVPGVDAVYIGPADLAASLGCVPALGIAPGVHAEAIAKIVDGCARNGVTVGIHCGSTTQVLECAALGIQMITISTDTQLLAASAASRFDEVRAGLPASSSTAPRGGHSPVGYP